MPPQSVLTRPTPDDLQALLSLLRPLGQQHVDYDPARFVMTSDVPGVYHEWLSRNHDGGDVLCLMAWSGPGGSPLGYVLAQAMPADAAYFTDAHVYIHDIYLVPDARGTGLADTLVSRVREWAAARGLRSFRALIASKNPQSLAFFARLGFRQTAIEVSNEWP